MAWLFLTGAPRAGTTYMREMLNQHSEIFLTEETRVISLAATLLSWDKIWEEIHILATHKETFRPIFVRHLCSAIGDFYQALMDDSPYTYWGDKAPNLMGELYFATIRKLYPDAKIINMHRDPRSVVDSLMQKGWANLQQAIDIWCAAVEAALKCQDTFGLEQFLPLRYEELLNDRAGIASRCLQFLDLEMEDGFLDWLEREEESPTIVSGPTAAIGTSPSKRLSPPAELDVIVQCQELMDILGYER